MAQHRITNAGPLLDDRGYLREPGWATNLLLEYNRNKISAAAWRIKEWDYYLITNDRYGVALTIADNSYMGLASVSLLDFEQPREKTTSLMTAFPMGKTKLPSSSERGNIKLELKGGSFSFLNDGNTRRLICSVKDFKDGEPLEVDITLTDPPQDSMVIATPFREDKKAFYYNQKINCLKACGRAVFCGREYLFSPEDSFGVLDWGRGVWTYQNTWYWGSASGRLNGSDFGFNIGYGFGDTSAASENMLFYNGRAHKLEGVTFHIPKKDGKDDYMGNWKFTSTNGRFEMDFIPIIDRYADTDIKIIRSCQHQVFGRFSGRAILDDGTELEVKDFLGFAEKVYNKW